MFQQRGVLKSLTQLRNGIRNSATEDIHLCNFSKIFATFLPQKQKIPCPVLPGQGINLRTHYNFIVD